VIVEGKFTAGPLGELRKCMLEQRKVKVSIRRVNDIRGYCTGYVEAFDKHFNLVCIQLLYFQASGDTITDTAGCS
jgi:hypothetical protein